MKNLKHKNYNALALLLLSSAIGLYSCKKEDNTNSSQDAQISFALTADQSAGNVINVAQASGSGSSSVSATALPSVNWTEGLANVSKFEFEAKKGNVKKEIEVKGLTNINLFALDPSVVKSVIDTGTYSEIELKLVLAKSSSSAASLVLKGSFTAADGTIVPVEINVNEELVVKTEVNNVTIDSSTDLKTTISLHLNKIFEGVSTSDLSAAVKTSGTIVISSTVNAAIYNKAKLNLQRLGGAEVEHKHKGGKDDGVGHT